MALAPATNDRTWKALNEQREAVYALGREAADLGGKAYDSGEDADYKAAVAAYKKAYDRARALGMPDLAQQYATSAASYEAKLDPTTPEGKERVARKLGKQAWTDATKEAHEAAAEAYTAAADAWDDSGRKDSWYVTDCRSSAKAHEWAAENIDA